jgi:DNA-binding CsgD family transcriptional regulator
LDLDDGVVHDLYQAAAGMLHWNVALARLDAVIGAVVSQLVVLDKTNGHLVLSEQPDHTPVVAVLDYIREYHRIDPHTAYMAKRPVGETLHTAAVFPLPSMNEHPFYRDFWLPYNVQSLLGAKIAEDDRHVAMIGLMRYFDAPAHSPAEVALAGRYFGHLSNAFRIAKHLQRLQVTAVVGHTLMASSPRPMILIDRNRVILAANVAAREFLAEGTTLLAANEVLACRDPESQYALLRALESIGTRQQQTDATTKRAAVRIKSRKRVDALCSIWDMRPETSMGAFGPQPAALLTIALPRTDDEIDSTLLGSMFDLTPAEVRLAKALMKGEDMARIATAQRISITTVRTQLKSIFSKTDTHRQAELVELLMRVTAL